MIVSALGVPSGFWTPFLMDDGHGFRPALWQSRCANIFDGGMEVAAGLDEHADDICELIENERWDTVHLIGWCNGGRIAVRVAERMANHVGSVFLVAPTFRGISGVAPEPCDFEDLLEQVFTRVRTDKASAGILLEILKRSKTSIDWDGDGFSEKELVNIVLGKADSKFAEALMAPMGTAQRLVNYALRTEKDEAFPINGSLRRVTAPLGLLTGTNDPVINGNHSAKAVAGCSRLQRFQLWGASHYAQHQQYPHFINIYRRFVRGGLDEFMSGRVFPS